MKTQLIATGLAVALAGIPAGALADHGNGNGNGHDSFPGFPSEATYGLCTAYENNQNGRDNGQAGEAPPFQELEDRAEDNDQTVEEYCNENAQHPGQGSPNDGNGTDNDNRP